MHGKEMVTSNSEGKDIKKADFRKRIGVTVSQPARLNRPLDYHLFRAVKQGRKLLLTVASDAQIQTAGQEKKTNKSNIMMLLLLCVQFAAANLSGQITQTPINSYVTVSQTIFHSDSVIACVLPASIYVPTDSWNLSHTFRRKLISNTCQ